MANSPSSESPDGLRKRLLLGALALVALGVAGWFLFGGSEPKLDAAAAETARKLRESYGPEKPPPPLEAPPPTEPATRGARKVQ